MGISHDNLARLRALVADGTFTARFTVEREIGHGGMGRVYAAVQRESGKPIAIKVLDPGLHGDPVRFQVEATILEQLDHPAIVRYVAHGLTGDGRAYLAMEWLEGESLAERLKRAPLSIAECVAVGERVAGALAYLHERDIVHRDIKPSNVFLVGKDPEAAVVIDLGIAKRLSVIGPTKTGEVIGTPGYMAPEQVRGEAGVDERVDMFALGCLLYEALSGIAPFAGQVVMEVLARLLLAEPKPLDAAVPPRLATLVAVLLAKNADDRTIDAEQAARELATIGRGLAQNDATSLARSPWNRPQSLGEAPTLLAPAPRSRRRMIAIAVGVVAVVAIAVFVLTREDKPIVKVVATPDAEVPRGPIVLPEDVDLARKPGPLAKGIVVDAPVSAELGTQIADAAWCPGGPLMFATLDQTHARISSFDRKSNAIALVAKLPLEDQGSGTSLVCLVTGRVLVVTRNRGFVLDGATVTGPIAFPAGVVDGVAVGKAARWLAGSDPAKPGALIEWGGEGPPRQIRDTCEAPRRLAPDGNRVACLVASRVIVDDGKSRVQGPPASDVTWSADSSALYLNASPGLFRWRVGRGLARTFVAQGGYGKGFEVGPWLGLVASSVHLARHWIGRGTPRVMNPVEIGAYFTLVAAVPEHDEVVLGLGTPPVALRAVPIEHATTLLPPVRSMHYSPITGIAFDATGTTIATRANDRSMIVRTLAERRRMGLLVPLTGPPAGSQMTWRADGTLVLTGGMGGMLVWDRTRRMQKVAMQGPGTSAAVPGGDELVVWGSEGIQELAIDGTRGAWLARSDLAKQASSVELDRERRYALIRSTMTMIRVVDLGSARPVIEVENSQRRLMHSALIGGARPTLVGVDGKGQVFAITDGVATPLAKLGLVRALAASPAAPRFAITSGREVIVFELERKTEILRGELTANGTALGWSRDGKRLAVAADNGELVVFDVP